MNPRQLPRGCRLMAPLIVSDLLHTFMRLLFQTEVIKETKSMGDRYVPFFP